MKPLSLTLLLALAALDASAAERAVVTADIPRFWQAYDAIAATDDANEQAALLESLYLRPGTPGLHALMARREYTAESYLRAIRDYPRFWASVRANTLQAGATAQDIEADIARLRTLYPALRPATIYFTIGALMTNGTTLDDAVLIGSEIAMADRSVVTDELPAAMGANLRKYFDTDPVDAIAFLNVHEYVHTQQGAFGDTLLAVALQEGIAEFVATLATGRPSSAPAIAYGEANEARVRDRFADAMFSPQWNDWLYNDFSNAFGVRDLGYYVGHAIAERYHAQAGDKAAALAQLIELDCTDQDAVEALVDASGYFPRPLAELKTHYRNNVPALAGIREFGNGDDGVDPTLRTMTLQFSAPMDPRFRGFDLGPLGEEHVLRVSRFVGFSEDQRSATVEIQLQPGRRHQLLLTSQFRDEAGRTLEPTLVEITTAAADRR